MLSQILNSHNLSIYPSACLVPPHRAHPFTLLPDNTLPHHLTLDDMQISGFYWLFTCVQRQLDVSRYSEEARDIAMTWWLVLTGALLILCHFGMDPFRNMSSAWSRVKRMERTTTDQLPQPSQASKKFKVLPSPMRLPLLGHLHLLHGDPFVRMTEISKKFGEIYYLQLGAVPTVVVSSLRLMKIILVEKGGQFGDRVPFLRYHVLFGGDKENSLAFCNWSETQKTRRALARKFCHTRMFADRVEAAIERGSDWLTTVIENNVTSGSAQAKLKMNIHQACANIFFEFFASQYFEDAQDSEFNAVVRYFDDIFWDINQNHVTDVLPALDIFYGSYFNNLDRMSKYIRTFVLQHVIPQHMEKLDMENPQDLVDNLLVHHHGSDDGNTEKLTMQQVLFELEDFIGGHAAVANLVARALVEITAVPGLSGKIYEECVEKNNEKYMQAVLYETLRKTSSPIVPHVASVNTSIGDYQIKKGTMVIFNNYDLNLSSDYWDSPEKFIPERFLTESGEFRKPAHFLPFSTGKRACMGYKLVEEVFEGILKAIITQFDLQSDNPTFLPLSCVALHPDVHLNINFVPRHA